MTIACPTQPAAHAPECEQDSEPKKAVHRSHLGAVTLRLLTEQKISLNTLAKRVGWNRGHLSRVFSGSPAERRAPSSALIEALADQLGHRDELREGARRDGHLPDLPPTSRRPAQIPAPSEALVGHPLANVGRHSLVLDGPPGSGTTAWARWWAHQIAERYPDGHLLAELREYTPSHILPAWLGALGVNPGLIPWSYTARVRLWQAVSRKRRLVVLLDGACDLQTVRDLRPAGPDSALIVTSRNRLTSALGDTGAAHVSLGSLSTGEARGLLVEQLAPHPVADDHELLDQLADACERRPLALQHIAARVATSADPRAVLEDLRADPLAVLRAADDDSLRHRLHEHLDALPSTPARLAQLLAHHAHPATAAEIAALRPTTEPDARRLADELVARHTLITTADGRYRMPDLLARAVRERRGPQAELAAARRRWCAWWLVHARRAAELLQPGTETSWDSWQPPHGLATIDLTTAEQARAWSAAHADELPTVITRAAEVGLDAPAWWYLQSMRPYLAEAPQPELARHAVRAARDASRRQSDQHLDQLGQQRAIGEP